MDISDLRDVGISFRPSFFSGLKWASILYGFAFGNTFGSEMSNVDEDRIHLDPGEGEEVYPRVMYSKDNKSPSRMDSDPAERYATGRPAKDLSRYSSTLRSMQPVRSGKKNLKGGAKIDESGLFSFITYSWVFEYLFSAFKGRLDKDQIWNCSIFDASNVNMARMEVLWEEEVKRNPQKPSLFKAMYRFISTRLWASCAVFFVCLIFGFIGPTCFIRGLVAFAENPPAPGVSVNYVYGLALVACIGIFELCRVLAYGATWAISYRTGIRVRGALLGLLFKRLITVRSLGKKNAAEIVNMFANDGQRLFDAVTFAPLVLVGPLVLIGGIIYLLVVIGPWSLLGIAVFFFFDVIQYGLGKTMMKFRQSAIDKTEKRISLMGEIIKCIRVIKMNAWEENFAKRIEEMRHQEKVDIRTSGYAQSLAIACGPVVPVVAAVLTFLGVVLSGSDLLASDAFSAITVFFVMLFGIRMIPYGSRYMAEAVVALRRIQEVLLYDEWDAQLPAPADSNHVIRFKDATLSWSRNATSEAKTGEQQPLSTETHFHLDGISLTIKRKEIVGLCGPVGSGKSALLTSCIGHMFVSEGEVEVAGDVAYVPQTAWIQNATVQENVLFGLSMNQQKYQRVLTSCQLDTDIESMAAKDQTEIGERGATLSGGQKARISLARAIFASKDIYLLDDVLASLDRKVANSIFENAIINLLQNRTVLMVTTDPQRLAQCDRVVYMEGGRIIAVGEHLELLESCRQYNEYCQNAAATEQYTTVDASLTEKSMDSESEQTTKRSSVILAQEDIGKLVDDEEDLGLAEMKFSIYMSYIRAAGSWGVWIVLLAAFILNVTASIFSTFWLSRWLKRGHHEQLVNENGTETLRSTGSLADSPDTPYYATVYGISLVVLFISGLVKALIFVKVSLNAGSRLHSGMFTSVIKAACSFFDSTPTGRILNRFSKDMDEIDVKLPFTLEVFVQNMITCLGFLMVIAWVFPVFLLACIPLFGVFVLFIMCFRAGIRSLKRSENISRSPLFDHITTSIEGLHCIHTYGQTSRFLEGLKQKLDANSGAVFMYQSGMRWLAVWLDLLVVAVTSIVALLIVCLTGTVSPADAGMAIAFAVQMSGIFQFAVRTQTELEAKMTSVERVDYYSSKITSEGDWETRKGIDVPQAWPQRGQITFQNVKLRYRAKLPLALDDVTFDVMPGEKVGIIGRTGSGKSSLGNVLYRMYPLTYGRIFVDGVDISTIGLHRLRRAMAVIPQDPHLFAGTVRYNLDPNNQFTDSELWQALEKTYIKTTISNLEKKLLADVHTAGENFSVGERQLLCLARAILMKSRIVLLDEATASLDLSTDKLIQKVIHDAFKESTILLIAHRLENVSSMDKVLLMEAGRVAEYDKPSVLLNRTTSGIHGVPLERREGEIIVPEEANDSEEMHVVEPPASRAESTPEIIEREEESADDEVGEMIEAAREEDVLIPERDSDSTDEDLEILEKCDHELRGEVGNALAVFYHLEYAKLKTSTEEKTS